MKAEPSELVVVDGDEYALIDPNNRRAHICWWVFWASCTSERTDRCSRTQNWHAELSCTYPLYSLCWSGCDTRNAIFVVNGISLCFYLLAIVSFSLITGDKLSYDDDQVQTVMDTLDNAKIGLTISTFAMGMICNVTAMCGATFFNKIATCIGGMWFLFETIRSLCFYNIASASIAACFCYPHTVFFFELKNGVMSRENYPKEKVCCDCCCICWFEDWVAIAVIAGYREEIQESEDPPLLRRALQYI